MTGITQAAPDAANITAPRPQIRIDWQHGASLLVEGHRPAAVAAALGIPEVRLWRHLRHSLRFRILIGRAMERQRLLAQIQYGSLQAATVHQALRGERPDGAALQWLSAEVAPADAAASGQALVDQLGETAARLPSQALRNRLAAEKARMDAQVAESREALARHMAARRQAEAVTAKPDSTATASNSTATAPDLTATAQVSTPTASVSTPTAPDLTATVQVSTPTASDSTATASRPALARSAVMPPRDYGPPRSIVDLTDMDGNPLPGVEWPEKARHPGRA